MSADNSVIILKSPKDNDFEYRVVHCQAIDNIYWNDKKNGYQDDPYPQNLINYFGKCRVLSEEEAHKYAFKLEQEILSDPFCPILEYGINTITLSKPFSWYTKRAKNARA